MLEDILFNLEPNYAEIRWADRTRPSCGWRWWRGRWAPLAARDPLRR
ncbi:unnamed protein product, partial [Heterosigma akashiwo]